MTAPNDTFAMAEALFERRNYRQLKPQLLTLSGGGTDLTALQQARLEYMLGCIHEHELHLGDALQAFMSSEQRFHDLGLEQQALQARLGITMARRAGNSLDTIFKEAVQCREAAQQQGWQLEEAEALILMATVCRQRDQFLQMLELCDSALALLNPGKDRYQYYRAASARAWALYSLGRIDEGVEQAQTAFKLLEGLDNPGLLRRELGHFAYQSWLRGEIAQARELTQQQLDSALLDGSGLEAAMSRYNLGLFAAQEQDWDSAHKYGLVAWQQRLAPQGLVLESAVLRLLCLSALHLQRFEDALNYVDIAVRGLRDQAGDESALVLHYMAIAQLAAGRYAEAQSSWQGRGELSRCMDNKVEVGWMLRALEALRDWAVLEDPDAQQTAQYIQADLRSWLTELESGLPAVTD